MMKWYEIQIVDGEKVRKQICRKIASTETNNKDDARLLALKLLDPLNRKILTPESGMTVADYIENQYLPFVKAELRPSTYKSYSDIFNVNLKDKLGAVTLRDFRTVTGQRLLRQIPNVGHRSLLHIKSFLSGVFKHCKREGIIDGENPMRDVSAPGRAQHPKVGVYSLNDIERILEAMSKVDMKATAVISVAAFAGLRASELRGLRWGDYDGESLSVSRSVWRTHVGPTKTAVSFGKVPVLPLLRKILDDHRARVNGKDDEYIFAGERRGTPLNLANLARRVIIPTLPSTAADHQGPAVTWKGWHSFRRSLASNLYLCGVSPKVIQAIMRHSDIGTTLSYYVATPDAESRAALEKIEKWITEGT